MKNRKTAIFLGLLLIFSFLFGILSSVPVIEKPDYIEILAQIETQVLIAVFFQAAMAIVYVGIAILFYAIIKKLDEKLAASCFSFRIIGVGFLFLGISFLLLLLWLSKSYTGVFSQPDQSYYQITGELLRKGGDIINHIGMILPWSIGGLILYYCLYKLKIIPRFLSIWVIIGSVFTFVSTLFLMLNIIKLTDPIYFVLNTPIAFCELILAIYLISRGFTSFEIIKMEV